jgi:exosortase/archaeosortase family protein
MREKIQSFLEEKLPDREELSERQERLLDTNVFMGKMLVVGAIFHAILFLYPNTVPVQAAFADLIRWITNLFGYSFRSSGVFILGGESAYEITQDCLGWKSMMAFAALMYASPGKLRDNLNYLSAGLLLIVVANIVRVVTTIHLSELGIISFEIIHGVLWKWGLTAVVLAGWVLWFRKLQ